MSYSTIHTFLILLELKLRLACDIRTLSTAVRSIVHRLQETPAYRLTQITLTDISCVREFRCAIANLTVSTRKKSFVTKDFVTKVFTPGLLVKSNNSFIRQASSLYSNESCYSSKRNFFPARVCF